MGTTKDVFEELLSHQLLLQLYGSISEVSLLLAGRSPVNWWPPAALPSSGSTGSFTGAGDTPAAGTTPQALAPHQPPTDAAAAAEGAGAAADSYGTTAGGHTALQLAAAAVDALGSGARHHQQQPAVAAPGGQAGNGRGLLVSLDEEVDLVAVKFQGAQVGVTVSGEGFTTEVAMAALTMDDLLVGARNPHKAHMAHSSITWEQEGQQQRKVDARVAGAGGQVGGERSRRRSCWGAGVTATAGTEAVVVGVLSCVWLLHSSAYEQEGSWNQLRHPLSRHAYGSCERMLDWLPAAAAFVA